MQMLQVTKDIYWVGALNANLRIFDVFLHTKHGTTYNSYLIKSKKPALVEAVHAKFTEEFLDKVKSLIDPKELAYIIVNHTEMDHTGALKELLRVAPNAEIVSSKSAAMFLKNILNCDFKSRVVADGDTLDLGDRHLKFIWAPFWHWPDTMFSYLQEDKVLFPCDGFASHFCDERLFDDKVENFDEDFQYYYNHIMRPFLPKIREGLRKVEGLDIKLIAPSHGPILRTNPKRYIDAYREWTQEKPHPKKKALVVYVSAYGNTKLMAEAIGKGVFSGGCEVEIIEGSDVNVEILRDKIEDADGILFGTPTINNDALKPIWDAICLLNSVDGKKKLTACFGSYGWSGEAVGFLEGRLKGLRYKVFEPGVKVNFVPTADDLKKCEEFGRGFANAI